ncbi:MAG: ectoine/hydroxyectoine ABC transporter permease subunit EhuC [Streptosporangiales bacterium]|nr:ectoine/hydroxyectoine ABC transporter permease subunit EhuC [Streptosporangiales bacterium]
MSGFLSQFGEALPFFAQGVVITLELTILGAALSVVISFIFGLMALSQSVGVRFVSRVFVEFFRGTSLLVQMFWLFFALPLAGIQLVPVATGVIALGLNYGAYGSEVVRGGINAIPRAQWEATIALNMGRVQRMRRVILPQAVVGMIPPFGNWLIQLLKGTALVSLIGLADLTFETQAFRDATGNTVVAFTGALIIYFILAQIFAVLMSLLERRSKASIGQPMERRALGGLGWRLGGSEAA